MTPQTTQKPEFYRESGEWPFPPDVVIHYIPSDPRELFDLMVRYEIPVEYGCNIVFQNGRGHINKEPFTDHASKLEATTRVILRGVLARIEGEK